MKNNKGNAHSNKYVPRNSPEKLFESIKEKDIISQVHFAVEFEDPIRRELLTLIQQAEAKEEVKKNIATISSRINLLGLSIPGFTKGEIEHYQNIAIRHFVDVLHTERLTEYIEDEIRELHFRCERLEHETKLNQFAFFEDRDSTVDTLTENKRLKDYLEAVVNNYSKQGKVQVNIDLREPESFEELFNAGFKPMDFVDILKDTKPALIDSERNYIGKLKGAICVWYEELVTQSIVKRCRDEILPALIAEAIKGWSIDESMFGKHQKRAEEKYRPDIKALVSKKKLSLSAQKESRGK
jgi:hypothetical protein